jgi:alkaline phosphatase
MKLQEKTMKKIMILLLLVAVVAPYSEARKRDPHQAPKNVILIIGDGMGTAQVYSSIVAQKGNSQFMRFPYTGFSRTYSRSHYTTDSGAGGSALTTMHKVNNRHIAMSDEGTEYCSFFERAMKRGKKVGFVVTSSVLDATPAATYAHVTDRKMFDTISMQMAKCQYSFMMGGGHDAFLPENRHDGMAPLDTLANKGYTLAFTLDEMEQASRLPICALVAPGDPDKAPARNNMLCRGVEKALKLLGSKRNKNGFVLMIEGSQIDWACHNNDEEYLKAELSDFEKMLKIVLDFAEMNRETLVVVTADHETGGVTLHDGNIERGVSEHHFSTGSHTGVMVPVFAFGPRAYHFTGIKQNIDIPDLIWQAMWKKNGKKNNKK